MLPLVCTRKRVCFSHALNNGRVVGRRCEDKGPTSSGVLGNLKLSAGGIDEECIEGGVVGCPELESGELVFWLVGGQGVEGGAETRISILVAGVLGRLSVIALINNDFSFSILRRDLCLGGCLDVEEGVSVGELILEDDGAGACSR